MISQRFKRGSKWRTNPYNLVWYHHYWWSRLFNFLSIKLFFFIRFYSQIFIDKNPNFTKIWIKLAICYFLHNMFDTSHGWYFICNVIMNSNLSCHDFCPTFNWNQYNMLVSAKGPIYFEILSCYFLDVRLKLLASNLP